MTYLYYRQAIFNKMAH